MNQIISLSVLFFLIINIIILYFPFKIMYITIIYNKHTNYLISNHVIQERVSDILISFLFMFSLSGLHFAICLSRVSGSMWALNEVTYILSTWSPSHSQAMSLCGIKPLNCKSEPIFHIWKYQVVSYSFMLWIHVGWICQEFVILDINLLFY